MCPRFNLSDKEFAGIYPRLKNPPPSSRYESSNRRPVSFLPPVLSPPTIPLLPIQGFLFPPDSSNLSIPLCSHSFARLFACKEDYERRLVLPFSHDVKWNILAIIPLGKHAVPTLSRMGRTIETELYFKLNILDII